MPILSLSSLLYVLLDSICFMKTCDLLVFALDEGIGVGQPEVLISKLYGVDGLSIGSVVVGIVSVLAYEIRDEALVQSP